MAMDPQDPYAWPPGQPAPWLGAYGPAPVAPPVQQTQIPEGPLVGPILSTLPPIDPTQPAPAPPPPPPPPPPPQKVGEGAPAPDEAAAPSPSAGTPDAAAQQPTGLVPQVGGIASLFGYHPLAQSPQSPAEQQIANAAEQGVEYKPVDDRLADLKTGKGSPAERERTIEDMTPDDQARAVASMSPDEYVQFKARHDAALMMEDARLRHEAEIANQQRAADNMQMQQAAVARADAQTKQLMLDAQMLSQRHVEAKPTGMAGNPVLRLIAMTVGGAMSQYTGGRNLAIDEFNKNVENSMAAQREDIANGWRGIETRKGAIANELERHGNLYHAQETYRLAMQQSAANDLQTQLQQYDPAGSTAIRIRDGLDQLHAQTFQTVNAYRQQQIKNELDASKAYIEIQNAKKAQEAQAETVRHNKADEQLKGWETSLRAQEQKQKNAENVPLSPTDLAAAVPGLQPEEYPTKPTSIADFKRQLEARTTAQGLTKARRENQLGLNTVETVVDEKGVPTVSYEPMRQAPAKGEKVGKEWNAPNDKIGEKLGTEKAGTKRAIEDIDQLIGMVEKNGGQSGFFKSNAWQQATVVAENLQLKAHEAYGIEGFRGNVLDAMKEATMAGGDPTAYRYKITGALKQARKELTDNLNEEFRGPGKYTGKRLEFPDASKVGKPAESQESLDRRVLEEDINPGELGGGIRGSINEHLDAIDSRKDAMLNAPDPKARYRAYQDLLTVALHGPGDDAKQAAWAALGELPPNSYSPLSGVEVPEKYRIPQ